MVSLIHFVLKKSKKSDEKKLKKNFKKFFNEVIMKMVDWVE